MTPDPEGVRVMRGLLIAAVLSAPVWAAIAIAVIRSQS